MATVLNRIAQAIRDLKTLNVIGEKDSVFFWYNEAMESYYVQITARYEEELGGTENKIKSNISLL